MSKYYNLRDVMSYNRNIMMIIGGRSIGKTYAVKKLCIKRFLEKKWHFIYLRRYESELQTLKDIFKDVIVNEFPNIEFKINGSDFYINGDIAGTAIALSKAQDFKGTSFPDVHTILFDEFLIEQGSFKNYLKTEVKAFLSLYYTIDRDQDRVQAFLLANAVSVDNPYFIQLKIQVGKSKFIKPIDNLVVEIVPADKYTGNTRNSKFANMLEQLDPEYRDYAYNNKFNSDSYAFIDNPNLSSYKCICLIRSSSGDILGVWSNSSSLHISHKYDPSTHLKYTRYNKYNDDEYLLCKSITSFPLIVFRRYYMSSSITYSNINIKYEFIRYIDRYDHI